MENVKSGLAIVKKEDKNMEMVFPSVWTIDESASEWKCRPTQIRINPILEALIHQFGQRW